MIKLKRAYEPAGGDDGARFLVERLWPRGVRKTRLKLDGWLKDVAPSATLRKWFNHDPKRWPAFRQRYFAELRAHRLRAEPGDNRGAVSALVEHYEQFGDWVIRNLAEQADPELLALGRAGHRDWVARQFDTAIAKVEGRDRQELIDRLVCVCDVYTWKLLRRDMGRSQARTQATVLAMVGAILGASTSGTRHDS